MWMTEELTHLDEDGAARMVDVGEKAVSERVAVAEARVRMAPDTAAAVERGDAPKGDVVGTARIAGIQAAKRTAELIPLAHPLPLTFVDVRADIDAGEGLVVLTGEARTVDRTGVELEAMTACSVAALTVYDMVKGVERGVEIERITLLSKSGGRSGEWRRSRAAVVTVSTSKSAGDGEDVSGPKLRDLLEAAGCRRDRGRADPRRARADRGTPALLRRRGGVRPDRDHRRHRARARRRDAGGDAGRHRPRGARLRRGDAPGIPRARARPLVPVPGCRGHPSIAP